MNNIEIVKTLLDGMGKTVEADKTLAAACIVLLDEVMTDKKPVTKTKKTESTKKTAHKGLDHGKICALYKANWSIKAIAEEMDSNDATIRYHLKKEGLIK